MRGFVLTADDYAMTPGVTRGILALLEAGRISATGAMTNRPHWREAARVLRGFEGRADLGLHFNLTCGGPLVTMARLAPSGELPKLPVILRAGLRGGLPEGEIAAEMEAQLSAFEDAMGRAPDFVDGHQHVHALPGVRRVAAEVLTRRYPGAKPYLRDPTDGIGAIWARGTSRAKALLLSMLAAPFGVRMRELGFRLNEGFSGYSSFDPKVDYPRDFARYLRHPGVRHLVMCHPGEVDDELRHLDPATASRPIETAFLLSERFDEICQAARMQPRRFAEL